MDFKRLLNPVLPQLMLFLCGSAAVFAGQAHLYACCLVLIMIALWAAAAMKLAPLFQSTVLAPVPSDAGWAQWRLFRSALDQIPPPLLFVSPQGDMQAANRAARALFRTDDKLVSPPKALRDALGAGPLDGRLTVSLDTQAEPRTYAVSIIDWAGPEGPTRIAMLLDIQPEIRVAEAAALRDLMQVLSHEIMNALTPVASLAATAVDLMAEGTSASITTARDAVETLARRAEGLSRFVDAYRTLARLPPPTLKPTSVGALLDEVAKVFRSRWAPAQVTLEVAKPVPDVVAQMDMDLMVHALTNVLSNAADAALGADGRAKRVTLEARSRDNGVAFSVTDSGFGVKPLDRERVFQPFFTTKSFGTGVGLSFARQVALSHGGDLSLLPQAPDLGATFLLTL